jgi:aspartate 1-decarboxylase
MFVRMLKAKLHALRVTEAEVEYMGSLTLSRDIISAAGILPYEEVICSNFENGERWTTYVIPTDRPGVVGMNGPVARLGKVGDRIIAMSFGLMSEEDARFHQPTILVFGDENQIIRQSQR